MNRKTAARRICGSGGRFFGVTFVKKNGTIRKMSAKIVKINSTKRNEEDKKLGYITVQEIGNGYKRVNTNTILTLNVDHNRLVFKHRK